METLALALALNQNETTDAWSAGSLPAGARAASPRALATSGGAGRRRNGRLAAGAPRMACIFITYAVEIEGDTPLFFFAEAVDD